MQSPPKIRQSLVLIMWILIKLFVVFIRILYSFLMLLQWEQEQTRWTKNLQNKKNWGNFCTAGDLLCMRKRMRGGWLRRRRSIPPNNTDWLTDWLLPMLLLACRLMGANFYPDSPTANTPFTAHTETDKQARAFITALTSVWMWLCAVWTRWDNERVLVCVCLCSVSETDSKA